MQLADPDRHHFIVECRLDDPAPRQAFMLPSWIPGSYLLREFARFVVAIDARDHAGPVPLAQTAKGTWEAGAGQGELVLRATIHAFDLSVRGAYLDRHRAFFNGTSLFFLPIGRENDEVELRIEPPAHTADWHIATAMGGSEIDAQGFGRYRAENYDELIDHPFEIGRFETVDFEAAGVPHRLVIAGEFETDLDRVATDLAQLCTAQIDFFGRPAPFERYTFLGLATGDGAGGLEHRASSSLIFRRADLPKPGNAGIERSYQRFLALCSHEYFHSWHVKRTRPAAFMPYGLDRRNPTRLLWVFEGITSYYQERFLLLSGLLGAEAHLRRLAEGLTRVYRTPGRFRQSLEQSSLNAWDRLYKPHANSPNQDMSYYSKGALVALALDLTLRQDDPPRTTLDDIVRELWLRFGSRDTGVPEDGFDALAVELGGEGIADFLERATRGTGDPDLESLFAGLGLRFELRRAEGPRDPGGTPAKPDAPRLALGAAYEAHGAGLKLNVVFDGQPAEAAGLAPGDIIVALDRIQATGDSIAELLGRYDAEDEVEVGFFRGDVLLTARLTLADAPRDTCFIAIDEEAGADALARRRAWLGDD